MEAQRKPVYLHFTSKAKAVAFRTEMYRFRYAVRDGIAPIHPELKVVYKAIMNIEMPITPDASVLPDPAYKLTLRKKKSKFVEKLNER